MVRVSPVLGIAIALGVVLGLGLWTLVALLPRIGAGRLADGTRHRKRGVGVDDADQHAQPSTATVSASAVAGVADPAMFARLARKWYSTKPTPQPMNQL